MQASEAERLAAALERVYARPEFAGRSTPGLLDYLAALWRQFVSWLGRIFIRPELFADWSPIVLRMVIGLLVAVAVGAAAYLIWITVSHLLSRPRGSGPPPVVTGAPKGIADWEAEARRAESEGRLRDAAIALYHAAILRLQEHGTLLFRIGKTPEEYRREVRADPAVAASFDRIVRYFLPLAFGPSP